MEGNNVAETVKQQAELIQQLLARIVELEAEIARLQKNSSTSSKPPSSDIVKPQKAANEDGTRKKRTRGAQQGHTRHLRKPFPPEQVDTFVKITLESCPRCGGALEQTDKEPEIHQQVELVEKPFIVTEYQLPQYWCEHCQTYHTGTVPEEVAKTGLFGVSLIALVAYLKGRCHISYTALKDFFEAVLGIKISRGFLAKQVEKVSRSLKESYEGLVAGLKEAPSINIDETGWKREGKKEWIWCFKTEKRAVFWVSFSRGHEVLKAVLGEEYHGIIICDFWGAYRVFKRISSCLLQFCWAHLIREMWNFVPFRLDCAASPPHYHSGYTVSCGKS
jgi:transposase